uniref:NTF2 domain-containing protein n=1 Tax=Electrophorus electricus TaxID=8005 RepID=A0A4W4GDS5_ELEEL
MADDSRYYNGNMMDRVGSPHFCHRKGRGPFRGRVHNEPVRQRHRGFPAGGFGPGPPSRFEDDCDVDMTGGQDGPSHRRFNPYGRPTRRGEGRFDLDRRGGGFWGCRSTGGSGVFGDAGRLGGGVSSDKSKTWYKITIPYGRKYDKKWLLTALQNLCPIPIIPMHYATEGQKVQFYLEDATAASALCKITRRITDREGYKVVVWMNACSPPSFLQSDLKDQDLVHLKQCMSKRFDRSEQFLDLNSIRTDPELVSQNIEVILSRKSCMQAVVKIIEENIPELVSLNLSNNRLYKLDDLADLVNKVTFKLCPPTNLKSTSIIITRYTFKLDKVKGFKLAELWLDRNPLCDHFKDKPTYIRSVCIPSAAPSNYFGSEEIKEFIVRFLQQYYSVYDSGDRQPLLDAYHDGACFSLSLPVTMHIPSRSSLGDYNKDNRNIKKVKDPGTRFRLLKHTRLNVVAFLNELPKTQHDTASFTVDVNTYTQTLLAFTVSGVFKEVDGKSRDSVHAFFRVFIAVPAMNSGLCLVNDELFVRNAAPEEIRRAFAAPGPTPSSSPVPTLSASQQEMLSAFSQKSQMNLEWSQKCLQHSEWNFNRAVQTFTELKVKPNRHTSRTKQYYILCL